MARLCALTAAVLVCALLPGSAQAGTAGLVDLPQADGSTIRAMLFVADPGETNSTELSY